MTNISAIQKQRFFEQGSTLPVCVNEGCSSPVRVRDWKYLSFKTECGSCSDKRRAGIERPGIKYHKKSICENMDGHLGFPCVINKNRLKRLISMFGADTISGLFDMDHVGGNHHNNTSDNVRTYCKYCHGIKSHKSGDCSNTKPSARSLK